MNKIENPKAIRLGSKAAAGAPPGIKFDQVRLPRL